MVERINPKDVWLLQGFLFDYITKEQLNAMAYTVIDVNLLLDIITFDDVDTMNEQLRDAYRERKISLEVAMPLSPNTRELHQLLASEPC